MDNSDKAVANWQILQACPYSNPVKLSAWLQDLPAWACQKQNSLPFLQLVAMSEEEYSERKTYVDKYHCETKQSKLARQCYRQSVEQLKEELQQAIEQLHGIPLTMGMGFEEGSESSVRLQDGSEATSTKSSSKKSKSKKSSKSQHSVSPILEPAARTSRDIEDDIEELQANQPKPVLRTVYEDVDTDFRKAEIGLHLYLVRALGTFGRSMVSQHGGPHLLDDSRQGLKLFKFMQTLTKSTMLLDAKRQAVYIKWQQLEVMHDKGNLYTFRRQAEGILEEYDAVGGFLDPEQTILHLSLRIPQERFSVALIKIRSPPFGTKISFSEFWTYLEADDLQAKAFASIKTYANTGRPDNSNQKPNNNYHPKATPRTKFEPPRSHDKGKSASTRPSTKGLQLSRG